MNRCRYTIQIHFSYLIKWKDIESFCVLEDAIKYVEKLCLNKGCEFIFFRIYDNIENKVIINWK